MKYFKSISRDKIIYQMAATLQAFSAVFISIGLLMHDVDLFLATVAILLVIASIALAVYGNGLQGIFAPLWVTVAVASILLCLVAVNNYFGDGCVLNGESESMNFLSKFTTNFCPRD